ncbi:MAG: hypothetical protein C0183_22590 [Roseiflexus castenholzii]|uniref:hypothetical protein n=1 Tax=Roseiflexus castenholzii TaxID=120962 RepID=UPI000CB17135|nr:MAG: hypothetical protein C0183_22590 [Roseiflexus castenholzii]
MSATTDIPGMDRPIEEYVERWRHRHATERERHRRWAQQARHDAERIAAMLRQESGATRVILFGLARRSLVASLPAPTSIWRWTDSHLPTILLRRQKPEN